MTLTFSCAPIRLLPLYLFDALRPPCFLVKLILFESNLSSHRRFLQPPLAGMVSRKGFETWKLLRANPVLLLGLLGSLKKWFLTRNLTILIMMSQDKVWLLLMDGVSRSFLHLVRLGLYVAKPLAAYIPAATDFVSSDPPFPSLMTDRSVDNPDSDEIGEIIWEPSPEPEEPFYPRLIIESRIGQSEVVLLCHT